MPGSAYTFRHPEHREGSSEVLYRILVIPDLFRDQLTHTRHPERREGSSEVLHRILVIPDLFRDQFTHSPLVYE